MGVQIKTNSKVWYNFKKKNTEPLIRQIKKKSPDLDRLDLFRYPGVKYLEIWSYNYENYQINS